MKTFSKNLAIANRVDPSLEKSVFYALFFAGQTYDGGIIGFLSVPDSQPLYLSTVEVTYQGLPSGASTLALMRTTSTHVGISPTILNESDFTGANVEAVEDSEGSAVEINVSSGAKDITHSYGKSIQLEGGYKYFLQINTSNSSTGEGVNVLLGTTLINQ